MPTLDEANETLKAAVAERLASTPADDPKMTGYRPQPQTVVVGQDVLNEWAEFTHDEPRQTGDGVVSSTAHPSSQAFYDLCDRMKEMHAKKSYDYGSAHDPLANIRNGAEFVGIEPWKGAMVRLSDKVTRLATYNRTGSLHFEGVEDTLLDLASYALLALVLYREECDA